MHCATCPFNGYFPRENVPAGYRFKFLFSLVLNVYILFRQTKTFYIHPHTIPRMSLSTSLWFLLSPPQYSVASSQYCLYCSAYPRSLSVFPIITLTFNPTSHQSLCSRVWDFCHLTYVTEGIMFSGCASTTFVHPDRLLPWYLMNGLSNLNEIYREYSLVPNDDLIRFWRSKVKDTAGHWGGKGIHVYTGALKCIFFLLVLTHISI